MNTIKTFIKLIIPAIILICTIYKISSQEVGIEDQQATTKSTPVKPSAAIYLIKIDNRLIGEWWTDSKDAIFSKISFGEDGSFAGYTLISDKKPFANGTYIVKNGGIQIKTLLYSPTPLSNRQRNNLFSYSSYSISDGKLQLILSDRSAAFNYYKIENN